MSKSEVSEHPRRMVPRRPQVYLCNILLPEKEIKRVISTRQSPRHSHCICFLSGRDGFPWIISRAFVGHTFPFPSPPQPGLPVAEVINSAWSLSRRAAVRGALCGEGLEDGICPSLSWRKDMAWTLWDWMPSTIFLGNWKSLLSLLQEEEETSQLAQEHKSLPAKLGRALRLLTAQRSNRTQLHITREARRGSRRAVGEMRVLLAWLSRGWVNLRLWFLWRQPVHTWLLCSRHNAHFWTFLYSLLPYFYLHVLHVTWEHKPKIIILQWKWMFPVNQIFHSKQKSSFQR